ncbi:hypothetical protein UY3_00640 [Chelonia mydas]|uniref:Uncharacterized protein n=1 Tax=Chelonia mydas TaxID=8469 RepID=M7C1J9_CHEMY|nr:hypothetical protein UY3_00640 [Chelonia mydas]
MEEEIRLPSRNLHKRIAACLQGSFIKRSQEDKRCHTAVSRRCSRTANRRHPPLPLQLCSPAILSIANFSMLSVMGSQVTMNDITLLRITQRDKERMLLECQQTPGPYTTILCYAMIPDYVLLACCGKVSYHGGRNKPALPRNLLQRLLEESFMEMSLEVSHSIPRHVNRLFQ